MDDDNWVCADAQDVRVIHKVCDDCICLGLG